MSAAHFNTSGAKPMGHEDSECEITTPPMVKSRTTPAMPNDWLRHKQSNDDLGTETYNSLPGCDGTPVTRMCSTPPISTTSSMPRVDAQSNRKMPLPPGKKYHYFLSHRKTHSKYGGVPEQVARNIHDNLEMIGFVGFFDIDNLDRVSKEDLQAAVEQSCVMVVFLHDETAESEWCLFEWQCAESAKVPVKCVVDMQRFAKREVMDKVQKVVTSRHLWVYQWAEFTERHRRQTMKELSDFITVEAKIPEDFMNAQLTGTAEIENLKSELEREKAEAKMSKQGLQAAAALQDEHLEALKEQLRKEQENRAKMSKQLQEAQGEAKSAGQKLIDEQKNLLQQAKDAEALFVESSKKEMEILRELHKANAFSRKAEFDAEALREDLRREQAASVDQAKKMEKAAQELQLERLAAEEAKEYAKTESEAMTTAHTALVSELRAQLLTSHEEQASLSIGLKDAKSMEESLLAKQKDLLAEAKASESHALLASREELGQLLEEQQAMMATAAALKTSNDASHQSQLDEISALRIALEQAKVERDNDLQAHKDEQLRLKTIMEETTDDVLRGELHEERQMNQKQEAQIQADKKKLELEKQAVKMAREEADRGLEAMATASEELYAMRAKLKRQEAEQASVMKQLEAAKKEVDDVETALRDEQMRGMQQAKEARAAQMEASKKEFEALKMMNKAQADTQKAEMGAEALRSQLRHERGEESSLLDSVFSAICCCRSSSSTSTPSSRA